MKNSILKTSGVISIFIGIFLIIIQPFNKITGAIIDISTNLSKINFIIGLLLIVVGIIFFSIATVEERVLQNMIFTNRFRKEIKRADPRLINRALSKLGTGLADEKLMHQYAGGGYQLRTDKGGRIHYRRGPKGEIILTDYRSPSKHR